MRRRQIFTIAVGGAIGALAQGEGAQIAMAAQRTGSRPTVVGSWKLLSIATVRPNGAEVTDVFGPKPTGVLMYAADGYMSVHIASDPPARWNYSEADQATVAERAHAFDQYYGYYGRYTTEIDRGIVTHFVEGSLQPNEVGVTYERRFRIEGDRLLLTATPFTFQSERRFNRLVWQRVKAV